MRPVTVVELIRHGEPVGGRRYRGTTDDPLSEEGWRQMEKATLAGGPWQRIITSPLRRCREFAVVLGRRCCVPVIEDARLREQGFGVWEGCTPEELRREDSGQLQRFYADPISHAPQGAEPLDVFLDRVGQAWFEILARHPGERLLVIGHAGTIRAIISHVLNVPPKSLFRVAIGYAATVRIESDGERPPTFVFEQP